MAVVTALSAVACSTVKESVGRVKDKAGDVFTEENFNRALNAVGDAASSFGSTVRDSAVMVKDGVVDWYNNLDFTKFKDGWDYAVRFAGATYAVAISSDFMKDVGTAVEKAKTGLGNAYEKAADVTVSAGRAAKNWAVSTYSNITDRHYYENGALSTEQAQDLLEDYRKYCEKAENDGTAIISFGDYLDEAELKPEIRSAMLSTALDGQKRIIPEDCIDDALAYIKGETDDLTAAVSKMTSAEASQFRDTLDDLKSRRLKDAPASAPSKESVQAVAELAEKGQVSLSEFGMSTTNYITSKYVLKQSIGAGAESAVLSAVFTIGPDLYSIMVQAAKSGEIDEEELKKTGIDGAIAAGRGFVEGSVSAAMVMACKSGTLGEGLTKISPELIGTLTVVSIDAIRYGFSLAKGEITSEDYGNLLAEEVVVASVAQGSGAILQTLLPFVPFAYLAGSLAGSMLGSVGYNFVREVTLEIKDGGGFAAVVPQFCLSTLDVAAEKIASLNLSLYLTNFKDMVVSTFNNGLITIGPSKTS